jgi:hypothetical protein
MDWRGVLVVIHRVGRAGVRHTLPVRAAPYWQVLGRNCAIGYRKTVTGPGTWIARWTNDQNVHRSKALGRIDELSFGKACVKAKEWFTQCRGGPLHSNTVETACKDYVTNQKQEKGERSAAYSEGRFKQHVYGKDIARKKLDELTSRDVTNWRNGLLSSMKKRSANRVLRSFKAALNYAFHQGTCGTGQIRTTATQDSAAKRSSTYYAGATHRLITESARPIAFGVLVHSHETLHAAGARCSTLRRFIQWRMVCTLPKGQTWRFAATNLEHKETYECEPSMGRWLS